MCFIIIFANTLHISDIKLTGRYYTDLFFGPFLNKGMMFAFFHSKGTIPPAVTC